VDWQLQARENSRDSRALIELINPEVVKQINVVPFKMETPWRVLLADDSSSEISEYVWIDVTSMCRCPVRAYLSGNGNMYDLLLSKRWMHACPLSKTMARRHSRSASRMGLLITSWVARQRLNQHGRISSMIPSLRTRSQGTEVEDEISDEHLQELGRQLEDVDYWLIRQDNSL